MDVSQTSDACASVLDAVSGAVIVDDEVLRTILTGFLGRGHVLLEDVPGTGKTLTARSFASALGLSFSRIQFTPDLLPADVTGTDIYNERTGEFEFKRGPLFANVVLADEINRASPKTQAALLEAMEERQVTVTGETHQLSSPFFVIATQNPVERGEGTFPLPEAQKDRFLVKTSLGYPSATEELELLERRDTRDARTPSVERALSTTDVRAIQESTERIRVHRDVKRYIVDLVRATRTDRRVRVGVSPRGSQRLFEVARARAALAGRTFVTPDDVKDAAVPTLAHRVVLTSDARVAHVSKADVVADVLGDVSVPTIPREARL